MSSGTEEPIKWIKAIKNVQTKITVHAWTHMVDHKELEDNVRLLVLTAMLLKIRDAVPSRLVTLLI